MYTCVFEENDFDVCNPITDAIAFCFGATIFFHVTKYKTNLSAYNRIRAKVTLLLGQKWNLDKCKSNILVEGNCNNFS
jgi:hypothetical protein